MTKGWCLSRTKSISCDLKAMWKHGMTILHPACNLWGNGSARQKVFPFGKNQIFKKHDNWNVKRFGNSSMVTEATPKGSIVLQDAADRGVYCGKDLSETFLFSMKSYSKESGNTQPQKRLGQKMRHSAYFQLQQVCRPSKMKDKTPHSSREPRQNKKESFFTSSVLKSSIHLNLRKYVIRPGSADGSILLKP